MRFVALLLIIVLAGCTKAPLDTSRSELTQARQLIADARAAGAEQHDPANLAVAETALLKAAHELDESPHSLETARLIAIAEDKALAALNASNVMIGKPIVGKPMVRSPQTAIASKNGSREKPKRIAGSQPRSHNSSDVSQSSDTQQHSRSALASLPASSIIRFAYNKALLSRQSISVLDAALEQLARHKGYQLTVHGHTCSIGSESYNMRLSQRRADAARYYLIRNGVDEALVKTFAHGETEPLNGNKTEAERELNRRVEVVFKSLQTVNSND